MNLCGDQNDAWRVCAMCACHVKARQRRMPSPRHVHGVRVVHRTLKFQCGCCSMLRCFSLCIAPRCSALHVPRTCACATSSRDQPTTCALFGVRPRRAPTACAHGVRPRRARDTPKCQYNGMGFKRNVNATAWVINVVMLQRIPHSRIDDEA